MEESVQFLLFFANLNLMYRDGKKNGSRLRGPRQEADHATEDPSFVTIPVNKIQNHRITSDSTSTLSRLTRAVVAYIVQNRGGIRLQ